MGEPDRQLAAIETVAARASSMTKRVALMFIVPAVLLVPVVYLIVREIQFALIGVNIPYASGAVAMAVALAPAIFLGRRVARAAMRARRNAWILDAAQLHGVRPEVIAEFIGDFG